MSAHAPNEADQDSVCQSSFDSYYCSHGGAQLKHKSVRLLSRLESRWVQLSRELGVAVLILSNDHCTCARNWMVDDAHGHQ